MAQTAKKPAEGVTVTIDEQTEGIRGKITLSDSVVATIAALAAREIEGVHSLGKSSLITFGKKPSRGVDVEVGQKQAAFDLEIVVQYGYDIREIAGALRQKIAERVDRMAGREVVEVNIHVVDIVLPQDTPAPKEVPPPRVL